jgi:hypothetical protein
MQIDVVVFRKVQERLTTEPVTRNQEYPKPNRP